MASLIMMLLTLSNTIVAPAFATTAIAKKKPVAAAGAKGKPVAKPAIRPGAVAKAAPAKLRAGVAAPKAAKPGKPVAAAPAPVKFEAIRLKALPTDPKPKVDDTTLTIVTKVKATVFDGGIFVGVTNQAIALDAGSHTISVSAEGYQELKRTVVLRKGNKMKLPMDLRKPAPPPRPQPKAPQTIMSASMPAAAAAGAAMGTASPSVRPSAPVAKKSYGLSYDKELPGSHNPPEPAPQQQAQVQQKSPDRQNAPKPYSAPQQAMQQPAPQQQMNQMQPQGNGGGQFLNELNGQPQQPQYQQPQYQQPQMAPYPQQYAQPYPMMYQQPVYAPPPMYVAPQPVYAQPPVYVAPLQQQYAQPAYQAPAQQQPQQYNPGLPPVQAGPVGGGAPTAVRTKKSNRSGVVALLPFGIGQFQNDQPVKGALFATTEAGCLIGGVVMYYKWAAYKAQVDATRASNTTNQPDSELFVGDPDAYLKKIDMIWMGLIGGFVLTDVIGIIDSFVNINNPVVVGNQGNQNAPTHADTWRFGILPGVSADGRDYSLALKFNF